MIIRIALTGGGTGGHLNPLFAVADELQATAGLNLRLTYFGPETNMVDEFEIRNITVIPIASSKLRRYIDIQNIIDIPKFFFGILQALIGLYKEMPDVVFSKGGPGALPVIIAARWYMIPIVIHDSDATPGLTSRLSAKFAKRILLAFDEATQYFPTKKVRVVGNPLRKELTGAYSDISSLKNEAQTNTRPINILVLGGSQGSTRVNTFILDSLPTFLPEMKITHQTGTANFDEVQISAKQILATLEEPLRARYQAFPTFTPNRLKEALGAADIIISRTGSSAIFEIAAAGKPSILIPLSDSANDHQRKNAYAYAHTGAASVVEEGNMTTNLVLSLIHSMLKDGNTLAKAKMAARGFFKPRAARDVAEEILSLVPGVSL